MPLLIIHRRVAEDTEKNEFPFAVEKTAKGKRQLLCYDMSFELLLFKLITQYKLQVLQKLYPPGFILFAFRPFIPLVLAGLSGKQKNK
jgi:hypothetical protein